MKYFLLFIPLALWAQTDLPGPVNALPSEDHTTNNGVCSWNKTQTFKSCFTADPVLGGNFTQTPQAASYIIAGKNIDNSFSVNQTFVDITDTAFIGGSNALVCADNTTGKFKITGCSGSGVCNTGNDCTTLSTFQTITGAKNFSNVVSFTNAGATITVAGPFVASSSATVTSLLTANGGISTAGLVSTSASTFNAGVAINSTLGVTGLSTLGIVNSGALTSSGLITGVGVTAGTSGFTSNSTANFMNILDVNSIQDNALAGSGTRPSCTDNSGNLTLSGCKLVVGGISSFTSGVSPGITPAGITSYDGIVCTYFLNGFGTPGESCALGSVSGTTLTFRSTNAASSGLFLWMVIGS